MAVAAVTIGEEGQEALMNINVLKTLISRVQLALSKADYAMFLRLCIEYDYNLINDSAFCAKLQCLLRHHTDVISALCRLPVFAQIRQEPRRCYERMEKILDESITAVNCIKNRCGSDEDKYRRFLAAVEGYRVGKRTKEQVYEDIYDMFDGNADVARRVTGLFGLAPPPYIYLPEKHRPATVEREDLKGLETSSTTPLSSSPSSALDSGSWKKQIEGPF